MGIIQNILKSSKKIRQTSTQLNKTVAILQDISGPKVRIGKIEGVLELKMGDTIWLSKTPSLNRLTLNLSYPQIIDSIETNQKIYFADGTIKTVVVSKNEDSVELKLLNSGKLTSRKGVNFPHTAIKLNAITPKDRADLEFGAKEKMDNDTILEAELNYSYHKDFISDATDAIAMSASLLSSFMQKDAIIVFTETGFNAKSVSKYRPKNKIIAVTPSVEIQRQLKLSWGVEPMFVMEQFESITRMLNEFIIKAKDKGLITQTSKFIVTMGNVAGKAGSTNLIRVLYNCAIRKMEERFSKLR
ncbi:MAG: hypothetical protein IE878_06260 [Epsilonproteobacteria bacterium]|nr:hypothetical protein [Campylobacterota bacterium]